MCLRVQVALGAVTHGSVLRSQVILQTRFGLVGFPTVGAVEQQLLQLRLLLPTLPHVVHVSHDAAECCITALREKLKVGAPHPDASPHKQLVYLFGAF